MLGLILGLNAVGLAFHAYEGVFIGLNIVSIAFGFYYTYLHKVKKKCDHDHCHTRNRTIYWIATVLSLLMMLIPHLIE
jgi:hypothetical protein